MKFNKIFSCVMFSIFGFLVNLNGTRCVYINTDGNVFYTDNIPSNGQINNWKQIDKPPSGAKSIAIDSDGRMLCVGRDDNAVYYSAGVVSDKANWIKIQNTTASVDVKNKCAAVAASNGKFAYVSKSNEIYYYSGQIPADGNVNWLKVNGGARCMAIGPSGIMAVVGDDNNRVYFCLGSVSSKVNWERDGDAEAHVIALGGIYKAAIIGIKRGEIFYSAGTWPFVWKKIDGAATCVAMSPDGKMLNIGLNDDNVYYSAGVVNGSANWIQTTGAKAVHIAIA